ncbi:hypothetical protein H2O73_00410 [Vibrio sp. 404]|uniref:Uncharacterized protein n=1 Tax=Vibrio marinisediminis TaxID=2758441 RepID=A0A7W2FMF7_9VIBR|nr:hypothetical protein [Vibrio marinisediminis]MBA5760790.1 hypothetical protein [Vibrio marinisediminis]
MNKESIRNLYQMIDSLSGDERQQLLAYLNSATNKVKNREFITQEELDLIYTMLNAEKPK